MYFRPCKLGDTLKRVQLKMPSSAFISLRINHFKIHIRRPREPLFGNNGPFQVTQNNGPEKIVSNLLG